MDLFQKCSCVLVVIASLGIVGVSSECTADDVTSCGSGVQAMVMANQTDLSALCQAVKEMSDCYGRLREECPPLMASAIDMALSQFGSLEEACRVGVTSGTETGTGCSTDDVLACSSPVVMMTMGNQTDLNLLCGAIDEMSKCFDGLKNQCPGVVTSAIDTALAQFENLQNMCQGAVGGSGCTNDDIMACSRPVMMLTMNNQTDPSLICGTMVEMVNCYQRLREQCPPLMVTVIDNSLSQFENLEEMCQGNSECPMNKLATCMSPLMNETITNPQTLDPTAMCSAFLGAVQCLDMGLDGCPAFIRNQVQFQLDGMEASRIACEYYLNNANPDVWTCSFQDVFNCSSALETMNEGDTSDTDDVCSAISEVIECLEDKVSSCPEDLKTSVMTSTDRLRARGEQCQGRNGTTSDPWGDDDDDDDDDSSDNDGDESDDGSRSCSATIVLGCMAPMAALGPSDQKELDVLCPKNKKALECMEKAFQPCPSLMAMFQEPYGGFKKTEGICKSHWENSAMGLKSNCCFLWVAAAMLIASLRHFL